MYLSLKSKFAVTVIFGSDQKHKKFYLRLLLVTVLFLLKSGLLRIVLLKWAYFSFLRCTVNYYYHFSAYILLNIYFYQKLES